MAEIETETLAEELRRLVREYHEEDEGTRAEAWNLIADFAVTNCDTLAARAQEAVAWQDDPSADDRWNAGVDYAQTQLCKVLRVDPDCVRWDAATETLDGDVQAVICSILTTAYGDDWRDLPVVNAILAEGQGDDDGAQIMPDFDDGMSLLAKVEMCLHLLEKRRDVITAYGGYASTPPETVTKRLTEAENLVAMYREAVCVDVKMEGPKFMGANSSALKRAWEADRIRSVLASPPVPVVELACKDCAHWQDDEDQLHGTKRCAKAVQMWDASEWDDDHERVLIPEFEGQKMFVKDGSDYRADLYTTADFFCAHFAALEQKEPGA